MSAEGGKPSGNKVKKFDMTGNKYAYIFSYDTPNISNAADTNLMYSTLNDLGFQIMTDSNSDEIDDDSDMASEEEIDAVSDDEEQHATDDQLTKNTTPAPVYNEFIIRNQKPKELVDFVKAIAKTKDDASCILLYFIAPQLAYDLVTADNKPLPLFHLWKIFKGIKCPKLFILQAKVAENARVQSVLLNSEKDEEDSKYFTLPESANMLLAYLPDLSNEGTSVAQILSEELRKPFDVNTIMTTVICRLKSMGCKPCPKFSSTLIKQLYFQEGLDPRSKELPTYSCRRKKCLAYAFLFGKFAPRELTDLNILVKPDTKNLCKTFSDLGFDLEFCVPNGYMTVNEFNKKLLQIMQDKEKLELCDCIMIIMSSHGGGGGILNAYDGCFSVDNVWRALSKCKELEGKPKVLAIDACRGEDHELPKIHKKKPVISKGNSKKAPVSPNDLTWNDETCEMSDVLLVMASTEGMKSYGNAGGSTFISNLCQILNNHEKENFLTIVNLTMHKVAHTDLEDEDDQTGNLIDVKQQVTFTSTLQKLLYLPEKKE